MFHRRQPWEKKSNFPYWAAGIILVLVLIIGLWAYEDEDGFFGRENGAAKSDEGSAKENKDGNIAAETTKETAKEASKNEKEPEKESAKSSVYHITAEEAIIVGEYGNAIQWNGEKIEKVSAKFDWKADPKNKIGALSLEYDGKLRPEGKAVFDGTIRIEFNTIEGKESWQDGGVAEDVRLYGATGHDNEYFPETNGYLAAWGRATIFLDGVPMFSNLDVHSALTGGIRREDGTIRNMKGEIYRTKTAQEGGWVDANDKEIQLFVRSLEENPANFPRRAQWVTFLIEDFEIVSSPREIE